MSMPCWRMLCNDWLVDGVLRIHIYISSRLKTRLVRFYTKHFLSSRRQALISSICGLDSMKSRICIHSESAVSGRSWRTCRCVWCLASSSRVKTWHGHRYEKHQKVTLHIWKILRTQNLCKLRKNQHNSEFLKFTLIAAALHWSLPVHFAKILIKALTAAGLITHWAAHARKIICNSYLIFHIRKQLPMISEIFDRFRINFHKKISGK